MISKASLRLPLTVQAKQLAKYPQGLSVKQCPRWDVHSRQGCLERDLSKMPSAGLFYPLWALGNSFHPLFWFPTLFHIYIMAHCGHLKWWLDPATWCWLGIGIFASCLKKLISSCLHHSCMLHSSRNLKICLEILLEVMFGGKLYCLHNFSWKKMCVREREEERGGGRERERSC